MDLLGSIMGSMDAAKPKQPPLSEKDKLKKKQQKEMYAKLEEKQRQAKIKFRTKIETQINEFLKKENDRTIKFEPMDKYHRSVIHDVSEVAGLVSHSFGEEEVDRHIQVWKKEFSPCDNELATLRRGEEWDPVKFQQERQQREWAEKLEAERSRALNKVSLLILYLSSSLSDLYLTYNCLFRLHQRQTIKTNMSTLLGRRQLWTPRGRLRVSRRALGW